jgi:hypothetical protein
VLAIKPDAALTHPRRSVRRTAGARPL